MPEHPLSVHASAEERRGQAGSATSDTHRLRVPVAALHPRHRSTGAGEGPIDDRPLQIQPAGTA